MARQTGPVPSELVVELDIPCSHCGYSLRGLKTSGRCPECRAPIVSGVLAEKLRHAPAALLRRFRRGARLVWWGGVCLAVGVSALCVLAFALLLTLRGMPPPWIYNLIMTLLGLTPLIAGGLGFAGWWLLTNADIARERQAPGELNRRLVRISAVVAAAGWLFLYGPMVAAWTVRLTPAIFLPIASAIAFVLPAALVVFGFAAIRRLRVLAARLDNIAIEGGVPLHDGLVTLCAGLYLMLVAGVYSSSACMVTFGGIGMMICGVLATLTHLHLIRSLDESLIDMLHPNLFERRRWAHSSLPEALGGRGAMR